MRAAAWRPYSSAPLVLPIEMNISGLRRPIVMAPKPPIDSPVIARPSRRAMVRRLQSTWLTTSRMTWSSQLLDCPPPLAAQLTYQELPASGMTTMRSS